MRKRLWAAAAVTLGLAAGLASGQANAATLVLDASTNYGGIVTSLGGGLVSFGGSTYDSVQQQDKLFSGFSVQAGDSIVFGFSTIAGIDTHSISIGGAISPTSSTTFGYTIAALSPSHFLASTASDIVQSAGKSSLSETLTPGGSIAFTKDSTMFPPTYSAINSLTFVGAPASVGVMETVTPDLLGTNISFVQNSFVQGAPGPVPGAGYAGLVALALAGLYTRARRA